MGLRNEVRISSMAEARHLFVEKKQKRALERDSGNTLERVSAPVQHGGGRAFADSDASTIISRGQFGGQGRTSAKVVDLHSDWHVQTGHLYINP